jgi:hypothetical protein
MVNPMSMRKPPADIEKQLRALKLRIEELEKRDAVQRETIGNDAQNSLVAAVQALKDIQGFHHQGLDWLMSLHREFAEMSLH